jgi:hypothetical protein
MYGFSVNCSFKLERKTGTYPPKLCGFVYRADKVIKYPAARSAIYRKSIAYCASLGSARVLIRLNYTSWESNLT